MKTFGQKLNDLQEEAISEIKFLSETKGEESHFNNMSCLKIDASDYMYNLDDDRYLVEINADTLVDNYGYAYDYFALDIENFLKVIDYLMAKYK
jgi:hypothetical protein